MYFTLIAASTVSIFLFPFLTNAGVDPAWARPNMPGLQDYSSWAPESFTAGKYCDEAYYKAKTRGCGGDGMSIVSLIVLPFYLVIIDSAAAGVREGRKEGKICVQERACLQTAESLSEWGCGRSDLDGLVRRAGKIVFH